MNKQEAFMNKNLRLEPTMSGNLSDYTFTVKDVFAIHGEKTSAGHPEWLRTHPENTATAPAIERLLRSGAALTGTTISDELMYSLHGDNVHYGMPVNPADPEAIPGGSSSGSASAAAAGSTDFALGTDTGGSVRVPSSYCGLYGIRPTHGAVSLEGVVPLAPSFDTVGWMSRDPKVLQQVGDALLPAGEEEAPYRTIWWEEEAWTEYANEYKQALGKVFSAVQAQAETLNENRLAANSLAEWAEVFRLQQAVEIGEMHREWIREHKPTFGPGVRDRFAFAAGTRREDYRHIFEKRKQLRDELQQRLGQDTVMVIPTVPGPAPKIQAGEDEIQAVRKRTMQLTCIAGIGGLPQVTIPVEMSGKAPISISIIANRNDDRRLLSFIQHVVRNLQYNDS
ncbi:amidase [Marinococcus luteus]|uniref:amidase n=1 Tax=Marinococcus luteus TaxID=1122204 RepID=UPI002ACCEB55|nr:amidase [Marinococcus luteus]MDZ5784159.1 amidase [Marinococcus luteus]